MARWKTYYPVGGDPRSAEPRPGDLVVGHVRDCELVVIFAAAAWFWRVRHDCRDVVQGLALTCPEAKQQAEDAARCFLDMVAKTPPAA
jgi:hypothetical protein